MSVRSQDSLMSAEMTTDRCLEGREVQGVDVGGMSSKTGIGQGGLQVNVLLLRDG